jgi:NADH:ubiquinone oxidoreductase subunit 6 (subunit J)
MTEVIFFVAAIGAIGGALGVVMLQNPFYSVLALVGHLLSLAALFLLLRAEFVAAAQVVVYAGAVMVLYVFVVAYVGGADEPLQNPGQGLRIAAPLFAGVLVVELCIAMLGSGLKGIGHDGAPYIAGFGSPAEIGRLLLTKFLLAFEIASYLLLVAAVGAVVLARRRRGLPDERPERALEIPDITGSMLEGVGAAPGRRVRPAAGATPESTEVLKHRGGW